MAACQVRALLMGGQACVFYGAAEFSRDTDLFLLRELRTPELLIELGHNHSQFCRVLASARPLLETVLAGDFGELVRGLADEEHREREADRIYWQPLKQELERLRHAARSGEPPAD